MCCLFVLRCSLWVGASAWIALNVRDAGVKKKRGVFQLVQLNP